MELNALRHFHETVRKGSIRRASEVLHVAASSVSRSISGLEHDLGAPLFERSNRGVRLTPAGEVLAAHTGKVFRDMDRARAAIDDLRGLRRGSVTLFALEGLSTRFLPAALSVFHRHYPLVNFHVTLTSTDRIVQALVDDEADIGITFNYHSRHDVVSIADHFAPLCCLVAPSHPLATGSEPTLRAIAGHALAVPGAAFGLRRMVDTALSTEKIAPKVVLETDSLDLCKSFVMAGDAVTFMPAFMVRDEIAAGKLIARRLAGARIADSCTSLCVHRDRHLSFAPRALLSLLTDHLARLSEG